MFLVSDREMINFKVDDYDVGNIKSTENGKIHLCTYQGTSHYYLPTEMERKGECPAILIKGNP